MDIQLFAEEKREQPTQKRRQEARKRGQVVRSSEIGMLVTLLTGAAGIKIFGAHMVATIGRFSTEMWSWAPELTEQNARAIMLSATTAGATMVLPVVCAVMLVAFLVDVSQVGLQVSGESISFNLSRINPFQGAARIFSKRALVELVKALCKVGIVVYCLWQVLKTIMHQIPGLTGAPLIQVVAFAGSVAWKMVIQCAMGLIAVAAADYVFQWREHENSIMMTRKELMDELKETEGRPEVKRYIRARQRQLASVRMMEAVKTADVVVTNPEHFAVALKYEAKRMSAPKVVAKGAGHMALRLRRQAKTHSVAVVENPAVARALYRATEVGDFIPPALYQAVAEILAFVYALKSARSSSAGG